MTIATLVYLVVFILAIVEIGEGSRSKVAFGLAILSLFLLVASAGVVRS